MKRKILLLLLLLSLITAYALNKNNQISTDFFNKYPVDSTLINQILSENISENMSEYEKVKSIHDYIILNTEYDHTNLANNSIPDADYTAKGVLENHIAVCRGYAEAFKLLMDKLDIDCKIVTGSADSISHAWNIVKIDNEWYQIDCTYDDPVDNTNDVTDKNSNLRYDYFLLTDEQMYIDHIPNSRKICCLSEKYMYQEKQKDVPYYVLDSSQLLPSTIQYLYNNGYDKVTFYFPNKTILEETSIPDDISRMLGHNTKASQFSYTPVKKCGKYYYTTFKIY